MCEICGRREGVVKIEHDIRPDKRTKPEFPHLILNCCLTCAPNWREKLRGKK